MRPLLLAAALLSTAPAAAQTTAQTPPLEDPTGGAPAARPADVSSPRALVAATYDVISGPAGPRDWARFRSLFLPGARMTVTGARPDGSAVLRVLSLDDYQSRSGALMLKEGFVEREVRSHLHQWAHTAAVQSLYETRHTAEDAKPLARGVNTFALVNDGRRWWIASLSWEAESPSTPIPPGLLAAARP